jgi:hypothetical protein
MAFKNSRERAKLAPAASVGQKSWCRMRCKPLDKIRRISKESDVFEPRFEPHTDRASFISYR